MAKKIIYSEPEGYFPESIRKKFMEDSEGGKKKTAAKKTTAKKKVKRK